MKKLPRYQELINTDKRPGVVVGSGPSLKDFKFSLLRDKRFFTVVVNDQAFLHRDDYTPDYWIFADWEIAERYHLRDLPKHTKVISSDTPRVVNYLDLSVWRQQTYFWNSSSLDTQCHTGIAALSFALELGAPGIALLGIDCGNDHYWESDHEGTLNTPKMVKAMERFEERRAGVFPERQVFNCSSETKDRANPYMPFEEWLCCLS